MDEVAKDDGLARLADIANVAQFVSFGPGLEPPLRHVRLRDVDHTPARKAPPDAIAALLARSVGGTVNVRSFTPGDAKGREFHYGIDTVEAADALVRRLAREGLHTIVNETVDVHDGGVSGVILGDLVEFAPDDTPRCVERPNVAALPREDALRLFHTIYGFRPALDFKPTDRVEFSLHPLRVGYRLTHTLVWEIEAVATPAAAVEPQWPNRFSRFLGDKAYGLLIADLVGLPVPLTTVVSRQRVAPFTFGRATGLAERWLRTCPATQVPGQFLTQRGWTDPVALLDAEDPAGDVIPSVLSQHGVDAVWSGATLPSPELPVVEGVAGFGDAFMQGRQAPQPLPATIEQEVRRLHQTAAARLGNVRLEWAHDGTTAWVLQLHVAARSAGPQVIVAGTPQHWLHFDPQDGLPALRALIAEAQAGEAGILVTGPVGLTSHVGDLLRSARVPARLGPGTTDSG